MCLHGRALGYDLEDYASVGPGSRVGCVHPTLPFNGPYPVH